MPEWLSRQIGPFPVWAWVGIIAAGGGLGWLILSRTQAGAPDLADTGTGTEGVAPGSPARFLVGANLAPPPSDSPPTDTEPEPVPEPEPEGPTVDFTTSGITTNGQWRLCALSDEAQRGQSSAFRSQVIDAYLAGRLPFHVLRDRPGATTVVNAAISHCGPPPNPPSLPQPRTG